MDCRFSLHSLARSKTACWLFVLLALMPVHLSAQIYKWLDENGNTHFGDRTRDKGAEEIELNTTPGSDENLAKRRQKQQRLLEIFAAERQQKKAKKTALKEEKRKRHARCKELEKYLQATKDASFLYHDTGDPDNPGILSAAQREETLEKTQAQVEQWCQ